MPAPEGVLRGVNAAIQVTCPAPGLAHDKLLISLFLELLLKDNGAQHLQHALLLWLTLKFMASHPCL